MSNLKCVVFSLNFLILSKKFGIYFISIEQHVLDTNEGKQLSQAFTDVDLTLALKKE